MSLFKEFGNRTLLFDGAMGTLLQKVSLNNVRCYEKLNITHPNIIKRIHLSYIKAGADFITTNTFSANRLKLKDFGLDSKLEKINQKGVEIAKRVSKSGYVAASIGPTGTLPSANNEFDFDFYYDIYQQQVKACDKADVILLETFSDLRELKAAIIAAKETVQLPIFSTMTFEDERTLTGTDAETFCNVIGSLGVDVLGVNCCYPTPDLVKVVKSLAKCSKNPLLVQPNVNLSETTIPELIRYSSKFAEFGVELIGGCCGTGTAYISGLHKRLSSFRLKKREVEVKTALSSRTKTISIGKRLLVVGERINPTKRKALIEEIKSNKTSLIRQEAIDQIKEGADLIDINVGVPGTDDVAFLKKAVIAVQNTVDVPIVIDSTNPQAIEEALKAVEGKALINSVNAKKKSLDSILPLAKKYGAAVIGLALADNVPNTTEEKLSAAKKIINEAKKYIPEEDVIVDCVTTPLAIDDKSGVELVKSISSLKKQGRNTLLGVSNISHGLPERKSINRAFLKLAGEAGLSLAILNPTDKKVAVSNDMVKLLKNKVRVNDFLQKHTHYDKEKVIINGRSIQEKITSSVYFGNWEDIESLVSEALKKYDPLKINNFLLEGLDRIGAEFKCKKAYLPQVLLSAKAVRTGFGILKKHLKKGSAKPKATIVFATVKDDVHDIGKNIVIALLETKNFQVIDLGKDVSSEKIVKAVKDNKADLLCLSALMTTTIPSMEEVVVLLEKNHIKIPVFIGGAAVTKDYADSIHAKYAKDAIEAIQKVNSVIL